MFKNIGMKIKGLAKFIFWVLSIVAIIAGLFVMAAGFSSEGSNGAAGLILGLVIAIVGVIFAWFQTFLLYGFGELIDSNQKILKHLEEKDN